MSPKKRRKTGKTGKTRKMRTPREEREAREIVAQVLVHFGAGHGAGYGSGGQIFREPKESAEFSERLFKSTLKHLKRIEWDTNQGNRDQICQTAHEHGKLAKKAAGGKTLTWKVIERTLRTVQREWCPPRSTNKSGGGLVCSF